MEKLDKKRVRLTLDDHTEFLLRAQAKLCTVQCRRPVSVGEIIAGMIGQMKLSNWKRMREIARDNR